MITLSFVLLFAAATPAAPTSADCVACHEDVVKAYAFAPHAASCTGCHKPTPEHIESPSAENVTRVPKEDACLSCHAASKQALARASEAHVRQNIACLDCHASGHKTVAQSPLLKAQAQEVCGACHAVQRSQAEMPYTHRRGKQAFACTDCHSLHGAQRTNRLSMLQSSGACAECHEDIAAPRVYEHTPKQVDGCGACHATHGSTNPRMLTRHDISTLCLECHTDVAQFHDLSQPKFRVCVSCHAAVHGSNRDARLFDE